MGDSCAILSLGGTGLSGQRPPPTAPSAPAGEIARAHLPYAMTRSQLIALAALAPLWFACEQPQPSPHGAASSSAPAVTVTSRPRSTTTAAAPSAPAAAAASSSAPAGRSADPLFGDWRALNGYRMLGVHTFEHWQIRASKDPAPNDRGGEVTIVYEGRIPAQAPPGSAPAGPGPRFQVSKTTRIATFTRTANKILLSGNPSTSNAEYTVSQIEDDRMDLTNPNGFVIHMVRRRSAD